MGGTIVATSTPGKGNTFTFRLPINVERASRLPRFCRW